MTSEAVDLAAGKVSCKRTEWTIDQDERFQLITEDWANARHAEDQLYVMLHDLREILDDPTISPELRVRVQKLRIQVTHEMEPGGIDGSMF